MKASYNVDVKSLKNNSSIWFDDAGVKNLSGTATLTAGETKEVTAAISEAGKIFQKISGSTLRELDANPDLASKIETFNNTIVRTGKRIGTLLNMLMIYLHGLIQDIQKN